MEQFRTKDIYEASALLASDAKFLYLEPESNFYWFVFENATACRTLSDSYWRNELTVHAKSLTDTIRSLKDQIFARRD